MHPDKVTVRIDSHSYDLSTIPYNPNTLTFQYCGTNNIPRDPLHGPVMWGINYSLATISPTHYVN